MSNGPARLRASSTNRRSPEVSSAACRSRQRADPGELDRDVDRVDDRAALGRTRHELADDIATGHGRLAPERDVLFDGQRRPQFRLLERAPEPAPRACRGAEAGDVVAVEEYTPAAGAHQARTRVERGGLPGAVRDR